MTLSGGNSERPSEHFLRGIDILRGLTERELTALAAIGQRQAFPPGEVLLRAGEQIHNLYLILRGDLRAIAPLVGGDIEVGMRGPGSAVPIISLLQPSVATNTLQAVSDVEAFAISHPRLMELLDQHPGLRLRLRDAALPALADRYRQALHQLGARLQETLEERQLRARTELEADHQRLLQSSKLAALGELISTIAHEVNNPLTGVLGYAQLLLHQELPERARKDVEAIYQESQRAVNILHNLPSFARRREPSRSLASINEAIEKTLALREHSLRTSNIQVVSELQPELPQTMADFTQLQQVLLNLIINAQEAMIEAHGRGTLVVTTRQEGDKLRIIVADDGPGIPHEDLSRVFDPFFTPRGDGTGLGLSLCRSIVQDHEGSIRAESDHGLGTTFMIELPLVTEETTSVAEGINRG